MPSSWVSSTSPIQNDDAGSRQGVLKGRWLAAEAQASFGTKPHRGKLERSALVPAVSGPDDQGAGRDETCSLADPAHTAGPSGT